MRKERPLYIIGKKHHWCVDLAGKSINADYFLIPSLNFIKNSKVRNIILVCLTPFYSIFLPYKRIYLASNVQDLLILKIKRLFCFKKFLTIHIIFSDYYSDNHKGIKRKFMNYLSKIVDGAIVPGKMLKKEIRKQGFKFPVEVSYHYPKNDTFLDIKCDCKSRNVINIGIKSNLRKGEDIFSKVAKKIFNKQFYLLGNTKYLKKDLIKEMKTIKNLHLTGHVNPKEYISKCTFYLLPGRYDAGPIALIEAMASGLIPLVSNRLGGQDLVKKVRNDLVINSSDYLDYCHKLEELMCLKDKDLKILSDKSKRVALNWTKEKGMRYFKQRFDKLLKKIK